MENSKLKLAILDYVMDCTFRGDPPSSKDIAYKFKLSMDKVEEYRKELIPVYD